tara:strand:- start:1797 stop:2057 length:261 start_codon:yes stop_codon:yes gene_type:complete
MSSIIPTNFRRIILIVIAIFALLFIMTFDFSLKNIKNTGVKLLSSELVSWTVFSLNLWALTRIFDKKVPILAKILDSTEEANIDAV